MAGVVVITTKKGKAGYNRINYTGEFTTRLKPNYNEFNITNSQEQMGIYKEMEQKGWLEFEHLVNNTSSGIYGAMYRAINYYDPNTGLFGMENTEAAKNAYLREAEMRNTDWFDLLFRNTIMQNHAVSITGGTEKARFYSSVSVMLDPGWTEANSVQRFTANSNASFDISKKITLSLLSNASYRKQQAPGTLGRETDVVSGEVKRSFDINPFSFALNTSRTLDPDGRYIRNYAEFNIFEELKNNYIDSEIADMKFQGELGWKLFKGLEVNGLAAVRYQKISQEHFVTERSNQARAYRAGIDPENATIRDANPYLYTDPYDNNALPETILPKGGIYFRSDRSIVQADFRGSGNYNTSFGEEDQHIIQLFAGAESNITDRSFTRFEGWGWNEGTPPLLNPKAFEQQVIENHLYFSNSWTWGRSFATFAMATYSYKSRYIINLTGRYEGTNRLGKSRQSRWLPTYNISGAWNLHEEYWFFRTPDQMLSHLTFKVSYSLTGDRGPGDVSNAEPIFRAHTPWRPLVELYEVGIELEFLGNSELTYEKKHELNIGTEVGFLKNRINLIMDVYKRDNFDLIGYTYTQGAGGFTGKWANVADMESYGFEATLSTQNIVTPSFTWTTDYTFSLAKNKITRLATRSQVINLITGNGYALEGYPVRALFSMNFQGLNDEGLPTFINEKNEPTVADIWFQDSQNRKHLVYEGPTDPTITGGLGNIFKYKNFRLNTFITYSFGNKVRLDPVFRAIYSDNTALPKEFKNRWVVPGDEAFTDIPVIASRRQYQNYRQNYEYLNYAYNAYNYSTVRAADGGFIRMKEISLSYEFGKNVVDAMGIGNLELRFQALNLFLIYADKKLNGQDPEFMQSGGVAMPMPKQFTFTIKLGI